MKKTLIGISLLATSILALPEGKYVCLPEIVINPKTGIEYKLSEKEMLQSPLTLELKDRCLVDNSNVKLNYVFTKNGIDYYKDLKESKFVVGLHESLDDSNIVGGVVLIKNKTIIIGCKYFGK